MNALAPIRRQAAALTLLAGLLALLAGRTLALALFPVHPRLAPTTLTGQWIRPPGDLDYSGCFRQTIFLHSAPRQAWLMIAAQDGYEVTVNGNTINRLFAWRPTRPFQDGLSEYGQRLSKSLPLLSLNFPREYQWGSYRSDRFPTYMDLTPYLVAGVNSIGVLVETRKLPARFCLCGEICQFTGERLPLSSDATWKSRSAPDYNGLLDWTQPHYDDREWANARPAAAPPGGCRRLLDPAIYQRPFAARWLRPAQPATQEVWLTGDWSLAAPPREAWLRLVSNRPYDLFVNGARVECENRGRTALDTGQWIISTQRALDAALSPDMLDPDEVGSLEDDDRFLSPPHTDPTLEDFHPYQDQANRTHDHPFSAAGAADANPPARAAAQAPPLDVYAPANLLPPALRRDRGVAEFNAYSIAPMLHGGVNHLAVRLLPAADTTALDWAPRLALDAGATLPDRSESFCAAGPGWNAHFAAKRGPAGKPVEVAVGAEARAVGFALPVLQYRGFAYDRSRQSARLVACIGGSLALLWGGVLIVLLANRRTRPFLVRCTLGLVVPTAILAAGCLVEAAWGERDEIRWFQDGTVWTALLLAAALAAGAACFALSRATVPARSATASGRPPLLARLPQGRLWQGAVVGLLVLCFFLCAYQLDFHPIDDDEYASIEASLAIAAHGLPKYGADVWYTRSPLYHYADAASILLFGRNLWAMRLPSVFCSVATAWLTYHCGCKLLRSPWVGLGAMVLYVLHPFLLFSAHIARFYQQQQLFALLSVYCFCRGFVGEQSMRLRYATVAVFLCCVLSQELSLAIGFQLAVAYYLFAQKKPWRDELRLLLVAGFALAIIAVDLVVFQTRCLTHLEGVSPVVEATLHPQFGNPLNFLSIFLAYSRLHLALSVLFLLGLPFALKNDNPHLGALYFFVISGAVFTNLLVTGDSLRYQYWLIPPWLLLAVNGPRALLLYLSGQSAGQRTAPEERAAWIRPFLSATFFAAAVLSLSPWRILDAYNAKLLGDSSGAFQFIRSHLRPGDLVAATEPHPHGALLETGRCDFDIALPRLYDFIYLKDGRLIDRNAGAASISSVDELQGMLAQHDRIWIAVNREKFRSRGQNIRWEYPGARAENFLRRNCSIQYQGYLWTVFLWDVRQGVYHDFRDHLSG